MGTWLERTPASGVISYVVSRWMRQKWRDNMNVTILVAIIGAAASVISLVAGKIYETNMQLKKIKEEQFIAFLSNIVKLKLAEENKKKEAEIELSVNLQILYLVGNPETQKAVDEYIKIFRKENTLSQSELYGHLIQAMRKDLYGGKMKMNSKLDKIQLTVFI